MLALPIFHQSRHIRLSLSRLTWRRLFAISPRSVLPLSLPLSRYIPLLISACARAVANSTSPHFAPTHSVEMLVSLLSHLSVFKHPLFHLHSRQVFSVTLGLSQSYTRNLIQNVPNAIHIIILVADNGKFVLDPAFILFPSPRCHPGRRASVRMPTARNLAEASRRAFIQ